MLSIRLRSNECKVFSVWNDDKILNLRILSHFCNRQVSSLATFSRSQRTIVANINVLIEFYGALKGS